MKLNFKIVKSNIFFKGKVFDLKVDEIQYDSGNKGIREVALHNGGAVVLPITDDGKIIFVKQYRYPLDKFIFELPAGKLETNEDPLVCATRELKEEVGCSAKQIEKLGRICTTPGFCTEILHIYKATGLTFGDTAREEGEYGMEIFYFTVEEVKKMIRNGEIYDAKSICGINYLLLKS